MKQRISRDGFPRTGDYLSFVKFFVSLEEGRRSNVFISAVNGSPGSFNFCVFPGSVTLPPESESLLRPARLVAELMEKQQEDWAGVVG